MNQSCLSHPPLLIRDKQTLLPWLHRTSRDITGPNQSQWGQTSRSSTDRLAGLRFRWNHKTEKLLIQFGHGNGTFFSRCICARLTHWAVETSKLVTFFHIVCLFSPFCATLSIVRGGRLIRNGEATAKDKQYCNSVQDVICPHCYSKISINLLPYSPNKLNRHVN